jgi:hypothetical protein
MDFHESLFALLPALRPDEPARLRQDILDELNDHLVCACNREMLRGVDAPEARRRALERFGDQAAVARRLWLDAMRGKIMAQRVVIGTCAVVVVASVVLVGIFWQQTVQAQLTAARQNAEARFREKEMLKQLQVMTDAIKHPRSLDWNPVKFSFTEETADGPPARDVSVILLKLSDPSARGINRESTESGVADFGLLNPGQYSFLVARKWSEGTIQTSGTLDVQPGEHLHKQIVCPKSAPQRAGVRLACDWPNDLKSERLVLYVRFDFRHLETVPGTDWTWSNRPPSSRSHILFDPSELVSTYIRAAPTAKRYSGEFLNINKADLDWQPPGALVKFDSGSYGLTGLMVLRELPAAEPGENRFARLAIVYPPAHAPGSSGSYADITIKLPPEYWQKTNTDFVAAVGATNKWMLPLPDELIQAVRNALKAAKSPKEKSPAKADAAKANG